MVKEWHHEAEVLHLLLLKDQFMQHSPAISDGTFIKYTISVSGTSNHLSVWQETSNETIASEYALYRTYLVSSGPTKINILPSSTLTKTPVKNDVYA